jgi:hypothetical protein
VAGNSELNGVRVGQQVRDLDGTDLGRVKHLYDTAFAVRKGFPILFRNDHVIRYDEVRGERDGALLVARSRGALFELARGEMPSTWLVPTPPDFPQAATPGEASALHAELAGSPRPGETPVGTTAHAEPAPLTPREEAEYVKSQGESVGAPPAHP